MAGSIADPWMGEGQLDAYVRHSTLGKGAYGEVFSVTHKATNQQMAMKKMSMMVGEDGIPQAVIREISTLSMLRPHENIIKLHDTFMQMSQDNTTLGIFMVMDRCDWDLYTFLKEIPRDMPDGQCRLICKQIVRGVDYLHSNNIIHRDLKPQNILINRDQTVKITDFGLSRQHSHSSRFTTTVVTLWYRSPELLLQCPYNSAIDIWAVGCIIREVYARQPLFPTQTEAKTLKMIFSMLKKVKMLYYSKLGVPRPDEYPLHAVIDRRAFPETPRLPIHELFPKMPMDGVHVVDLCLRYRPEMRCSALYILETPFLRDVADRPTQKNPLGHRNA